MVYFPATKAEIKPSSHHSHSLQQSVTVTVTVTLLLLHRAVLNIADTLMQGCINKLWPSKKFLLQLQAAY